MQTKAWFDRQQHGHQDMLTSYYETCMEKIMASSLHGNILLQIPDLAAF